ncbi:ABC transporter substrate-binding protein [Stakelama tenebrarum]|uniref:ABC transporter substrate-binding protein n=1 Tax=Stakelama tenebrarum TaxID=2711215 RepID=A0A6G6Y8Q8_9SPHN|nr:ABC transporter substrate-binding protein [Sphingosinithalassobacter tenebrarum]QIG81187.1 ABC transporter substrate-binding protein [Sphingosinithalassobacter tenebrarum]
MTRSPLPLVFALALALAGCGKPRPDDIPVEVSAIGGPAVAADPSRGPLDTPQAVRMYATAQGLVRFDANGQIVAGLAERWIVIDEGRSYIFRLRDAEWTDGTPVTAAQVAQLLGRAIAPRTRNQLAPSLRVIDEIVEMTPQVIEVRLRQPRPDMLNLFAQPELAIFRVGELDGSGPFRVTEEEDGALLLSPAFDPTRTQAEADPREPRPVEQVRLRGERAAVALARFMARRSDLILGGSFVDWPLVDIAGVDSAQVQFDPAEGLFGLAVVERDGFLETAENRAAIAMSIDRAGMTGAVLDAWTPSETLLPVQLDSAAEPAQPDWRSQTLEERRVVARRRVALWRREHDGAPPRLRIALPYGSGANRVWAYIGNALLRIGIQPVRVPLNGDADLRLIDAVAPYDSARWYLGTACRVCSPDAQAALEAARKAGTIEERAQRIAEADALLTRDAAFIPLAKPLRWSIVAPRLDAWQGNPRAWHPLDQLRNDSK